MLKEAGEHLIHASTACLSHQYLPFHRFDLSFSPPVTSFLEPYICHLLKKKIQTASLLQEKVCKQLVHRGSQLKGEFLNQVCLALLEVYYI